MSVRLWSSEVHLCVIGKAVVMKSMAVENIISVFSVYNEFLGPKTDP